MLSTAAFSAWSKKVVLVLHNTSRVADEPYPNLLREMGGSGFPTVSYLDSDGRLLRQLDYPVTLESVEREWQQLQAWKALRSLVEKGGAGAAKEKQLFLLELQMGSRPFAEMVQRRLALTLDDAERAATEQQLVDLEFTEILRATPRDQQAAAGEKFLAMFRKQRIPAAAKETPYWQYMFAFATEKGDVALFQELLTWLRQNRAGDARFGRYLKQLERQLEQLQPPKGR